MRRSILIAVAIVASASGGSWLAQRGPPTQERRTLARSAEDRPRPAHVRSARRGPLQAPACVVPDAAPSAADPAPHSEPQELHLSLRDVEVLVLDADGTPVLGADVAVAFDRPRGCYSSWRQGESGRTDVAGLVVLPVDGVKFQVQASRGERTGRTAKLSSFGPEPRARISVHLEDGVRLRGVVVDADDARPLSSARVDFLDGIWTLSTVTGADGSFTSDPCAPGWNLAEFGAPDVRVTAEGYEPESVRVTRDGDSFRLTIARSTRVRLRLVTPDGRPIPGRAVSVRATVVGARSRLDEGSGETAADGRLEVCLLADPGARIAVWPGDGQVVRFAAAEARLHERDLGDVVIREPGTVTGVVLDEHGEPAIQAYVWIEPTGDSGDADGTWLDGDTTDGDGLFELKSVGDGDHVLFACPQGRRDEVVLRTGVRAGDRDLRIDLPPPPVDSPEPK